MAKEATKQMDYVNISRKLYQNCGHIKCNARKNIHCVNDDDDNIDNNNRKKRVRKRGKKRYDRIEYKMC